MAEITYTIAFLTGIISVFSPCILPLLPAYFSYFSGLSTKHVFKNRISVAVNSILFSLGFSIIFIGFAVTATIFGQFLFRNRSLLQHISAIIIVIMGIHIAGIIPMKFLKFEKRFCLYKNCNNIPYFSSFLFGITFGFGWMPCIGPVVASMLALASNFETQSQAVFLMSVYSFGLSLPLVIMALLGEGVVKKFAANSKLMKYAPRISGALLITLGVLFLTNTYKPITGFLYSFYDLLGLPIL